MVVRRSRTDNRILEQRKIIPSPFGCGKSTTAVVPKTVRRGKVKITNKLCN